MSEREESIANELNTLLDQYEEEAGLNEDKPLDRYAEMRALVPVVNRATKAIREKYSLSEEEMRDIALLAHKLRMRTERRGSNTAQTSPTTQKSPEEGCFIATACCGTHESSEVTVLRCFRDDVLTTCVLGRLFIAVYYRLSPPVAAWLASHKIVRSYVRSLLVKPSAWLASKTMKN